MELSVIAVIAGAAAIGLVLLAGYAWGKYAARMALEQDSPKWKAYALALLPPAIFAITLLIDGMSHPMAGQAFLALATPATIGACVRVNYGSSSPF